MAAIPTLYTKVEGPITPASSWGSIASISGASIQPNGKYWIFVVYHGLEGSGVSNATNTRLTVDSSTLSDSEVNIDSGGAGVTVHNHVFTFDNNPGDVQLEAQGDDDTIRNIEIFMMLLSDDLIEGEDYAYSENIVSERIDTSYEVRNTVSISMSQPSDWMAIATFSTTGIATHDYRLRLDNASSGDDLKPEMQKRDLVTTAHKLAHPMMRAYNNLPVGPHTVDLQIKENSGTANNVRSSLFLLRLNAFKNHTSTFDSPGHTYTMASTWEELGGMSITPTVPSDIVAFGAASGAISTAGSDSILRIQKDGVTSIADWENREQFSHANTLDGKPQFMFGRWASQAATLHDIDLDGQTSNLLNSPLSKLISAISFTLELSLDNRFISGTITEKGKKVARKVIVYRRDSPYEKVGETTSASDGSFKITALPNVQCMVVAQDDDAGTDFNDVIIARVIPEDK